MNNYKIGVPIIYDENDEFTYPKEWSKYYSKRNEKGRKGKVA